MCGSLAMFSKSAAVSRDLPMPASPDRHHLAFATLRSWPASQQQFVFFFPANEGSQATRVQGLKAAFNGTCAQRGPDLHGFGDALELSCPEVLQLKEIAEKPSCALGDNDHIRLCESLQTRRELRRLAD